MRKPIEDEIYDIMARQMMENVDAQITALSTTTAPATVNLQDLEDMIREFDKIPEMPQMVVVFVARDGKSIMADRVIDLLTATEEDVKNVFRDHPDLGIDLTGADIVSFPKPKYTWTTPLPPLSMWEPRNKETEGNTDVEAT